MNQVLFPQSEEQKATLEAVRAFCERHFSRENIKQWKRDQSLPNHVIKEFINMDFGLFSFITNENRENQNLFTLALILEELSRHAGAVTPLLTDFLDMHILSKFATSDHYERLMEEYRREGRLAFSFAISEPEAGSDVSNMSTIVRTINGNPVLTGRKTFVNNGEFTRLILVIALDGDVKATKDKTPALSAWLVPYNLEGVSTFPIEKRGQRLLPFSDIVFEDVVLPEWSRLSNNSFTLKSLYQSFQWGRVLVCANSVGMAQAAMDDAVKYAHTRKTFGQPIAEHQQIKQLMTEMEIKIETMRYMLYKSAIETDENDGSDASRLSVALAKNYIPRTSVEVASSAIQIFGGLGYSEEERVYGIWEDCRGNQIMEGTDQIMVNIAAKLIERKYTT